MELIHPVVLGSVKATIHVSYSCSHPGLPNQRIAEIAESIARSHWNTDLIKLSGEDLIFLLPTKPFISAIQGEYGRLVTINSIRITLDHRVYLLEKAFELDDQTVPMKVVIRYQSETTDELSLSNYAHKIVKSFWDPCKLFGLYPNEIASTCDLTRNVIYQRCLCHQMDTSTILSIEVSTGKRQGQLIKLRDTRIRMYQDTTKQHLPLMTAFFGLGTALAWEWMWNTQYQKCQGAPLRSLLLDTNYQDIAFWFGYLALFLIARCMALPYLIMYILFGALSFI